MEFSGLVGAVQNFKSFRFAALFGLGAALTACVPAQDLDAQSLDYEATTKKRALAIADPAMHRRARNEPNILCMDLRTKFDPKPVALYGLFVAIDYGLFSSAEFAESTVLQSIVDAMPSPNNESVARYYRTVADHDPQAALKLLDKVEQQEITCLNQTYTDHESRIVSAENQAPGVKSFSWENRPYSRREYMRAVYEHLRGTLRNAKSAGQAYRGIRAAIEKPAENPEHAAAKSADASAPASDSPAPAQADATKAVPERPATVVPTGRAKPPRAAGTAKASTTGVQPDLFTVAAQRENDLAVLSQKFAVPNGPAPAATAAPAPSNKTPVASPRANGPKPDPLSGSAKTKSTEAAKSN